MRAHCDLAYRQEEKPLGLPWKFCWSRRVPYHCEAHIHPPLREDVERRFAIAGNLIVDYVEVLGTDTLLITRKRNTLGDNGSFKGMLVTGNSESRRPSLLYFFTGLIVTGTYWTLTVSSSARDAKTISHPKKPYPCCGGHPLGDLTVKFDVDSGATNGNWPLIWQTCLGWQVRTARSLQGGCQRR